MIYISLCISPLEWKSYRFFQSEETSYVYHFFHKTKLFLKTIHDLIYEENLTNKVFSKLPHTAL